MSKYFSEEPVWIPQSPRTDAMTGKSIYLVRGDLYDDSRQLHVSKPKDEKVSVSLMEMPVKSSVDQTLLAADDGVRMQYLTEAAVQESKPSDLSDGDFELDVSADA